MAKRKTHTPEFKAKVALEAIGEEMTLAGIEKLVVARNFSANGLPCKPPPVRGAEQTINCSGREAKNGEQGS